MEFLSLSGCMFFANHRPGQAARAQSICDLKVKIDLIVIALHGGTGIGDNRFH
tara:strand:- start:430 stop:588 length:159 start_codon:yes stop_codon:yes gene_type:complete